MGLKIRSQTAAIALVAAAFTVPLGQAAGAPQQFAQQQSAPMTFPYIYSNVKTAPHYDSNGKPSPWNNVTWDHATVLTRSQTRLVGTSGVLPVVAGARISPVSGLAKVAQGTYARSKLIPKGGCLALYWSDRPFIGPNGKKTSVASQDLNTIHCRP